MKRIRCLLGDKVNLQSLYLITTSLQILKIFSKLLTNKWSKNKVCTFLYRVRCDNLTLFKGHRA